MSFAMDLNVVKPPLCIPTHWEFLSGTKSVARCVGHSGDESGRSQLNLGTTFLNREIEAWR